jgi:hypothetical protein
MGNTRTGRVASDPQLHVYRTNNNKWNINARQDDCGLNSITDFGDILLVIRQNVVMAALMRKSQQRKTMWEILVDYGTPI